MKRRCSQQWYIGLMCCVLALLLSHPHRAVGQQRVSGTVVSAMDGTPLAGVSIRVNGRAGSSITDDRGQFQLTVPATDVTLVFTSIGYEDQEVPLQGRTSLQIVLQEAERSLDEVQITVPYGNQSRGSFTGSAAVVRGEDLADRPRSSFQTSLQGNVAGLQVMESTGQPGAAPTIRLRGITSFGASNTPLYVVDGVPMLTQNVSGLAFSSNSGAGINPNDIESVTVLKDASATSVYGSQAANGVIMITTKSGKAGRTAINFSANYGINHISTGARSKPLSTAEMTELLIEGVINSDIDATVSAISTPEAAYEYLVGQGLNPNIDTDWYDIIVQTGQYQQYNLSASGGTDKTRFFLSGNYYTQDAVTKGQGFERKTGRLNIEHQASDRLSFSARLSGAAQQLNTIPAAGSGQNPMRSLNRLVPWLAPYNEDGSYNMAITHNPELVRLENRYETNIYQAVGNVGGEYKLLKSLAVESRAGIDFSFSDDFRYWSPLSRDGMGPNGRGMQYDRTWNNWTLTNLLKFNDRFNEWGISATLGQEAGKRNLKSVSTQANNYVAEDLYTLANTSEPYIAWSSQSHASIASYFLIGNFDFAEKYYLNASVRRDGSSRFGRDVRYGNFWSLGFAWNLHKEGFMETVGFVDQLKLRASIGTSGNQLGEYYGALGYYSTNQNYLNQPGFAIGQIESGSLRWERNRPIDIGVEFALFNNRLDGTVDWYSRQTSDLIQDMPVSHTNGVTSLNYNVGGMRNYGVEVALNSRNVVSKDGRGFAWSTNFNITTQHNKITAYQDDRKVEGRYLREVGGDFYQFYLREYAGVDRQTGEALWYTNSSRETTTNDYNEAAPFKQDGKSALANFFGGITNTFSYRGVSLSALVYFNWGGYVYDIWGQYTQSDGSARLSETGAIARMTYENHWREPGQDAAYPKMVFGGRQSGLTGQESTRFLYDGSYIRLRDVTLSYQLPTDQLRLPFSNATIYVRGNNLYTFIKDDLLPFDPETDVSGLLDQNLPIARQYVFGINVRF